MSRITGSEVPSLMAAYSAVYAPQELTEEQIWEEVENWVNSLLEEGYDLSEYTWEEMYESYISEIAVPPKDPEAARAQSAAAKKTLLNMTPLGLPAEMQRATQRYRAAGPRDVKGRPISPEAKPSAPASGDYKSRFAGARDVAVAKAQNIKGSPVVGPRPSAPAAPAAPAAAAPAPQRPAAAAPAATRPAGPKVAPTKPAPAPTKPAGSAMDQWAKANPKLAAASAEKARIRGTQQTDNPLMKDMKSRLPMNSPSVQSPAVSKLGAGNQSLSQNPNAFKAATPSKAIAAAPSTSAAASGSVVPATAAIASSPKPTSVAPRQTAREKVLNQSYEYDAFDLVLEYLIDNGHVETVDEALYVMMEMDSETILGIVSEQSNTLITPEQRRADELKYGMKRTTPMPPAKPGGAKVKPSSKMPL